MMFHLSAVVMVAQLISTASATASRRVLQNESVSIKYNLMFIILAHIDPVGLHAFESYNSFTHYRYRRGLNLNPNALNRGLSNNESSVIDQSLTSGTLESTATSIPYYPPHRLPGTGLERSK